MALLTLLQIGDVHGHLLPRPNLRSDGTGHEEGGLARLYAKAQHIRQASPNALLFNTGDTIQGSAEALYTRGQALVEVIDKFGVDATSPATGITCMARNDSCNCSDRTRDRAAGTTDGARRLPMCSTRRLAICFCRPTS